MGYNDGARKLYKCSCLTKEDSVLPRYRKSLWQQFPSKFFFSLQGETLRPAIDQSTNVTGPLWISTPASFSLKLVNLPTSPFREQSPTAKCQAESCAFATSRGQRSNWPVKCSESGKLRVQNVQTCLPVWNMWKEPRKHPVYQRLGCCFRFKAHLTVESPFTATSRA